MFLLTTENKGVIINTCYLKLTLVMVAGIVFKIHFLEEESQYVYYTFPDTEKSFKKESREYNKAYIRSVLNFILFSLLILFFLVPGPYLLCTS